jgi:hypothetical protein
MSEMEPNDYQLVRIGLLATISDRAAELGQEIYEEADDTIDALRAENDRLREQVAGLTAARDGFREMLHDLRQQIEMAIALGQTDVDDEGHISAYHFKTGALHRLLAEARKGDGPALPAPTPAREAGLTAALIPFLRYANELLWSNRDVTDDDVVLRWPYYGSPRVIVRRSDFKALRAAIPVPNPGLPISPVVPNPGLSISSVVPKPGLSVSPAPPTEGGESS